MTETFEAIIDTHGRIHPLKTIKFATPQKVSITLSYQTDKKSVTEEADSQTEYVSIKNLGRVVGDLEEGSRQIAERLNQAIENSGKEIQEN